LKHIKLADIPGGAVLLYAFVHG